MTRRATMGDRICALRVVMVMAAVCILVFGQQPDVHLERSDDPYPKAVAAARAGRRQECEAFLRDGWIARARARVPIALDIAGFCMADGRLGEAMAWALRARYEDPRSQDAEDVVLQVQRECGLTTRPVEGVVPKAIAWIDSTGRNSWLALVVSIEVIGVALILIGRNSKGVIACGIGALALATVLVARDAVSGRSVVTAVISTEGVSLRPEPHAERLGGRRLLVGTEVEVVATTETWAHVRTSDGEGYVEWPSLVLVNLELGR